MELNMKNHHILKFWIDSFTMGRLVFFNLIKYGVISESRFKDWPKKIF